MTPADGWHFHVLGTVIGLSGVAAAQARAWLNVKPSSLHRTPVRHHSCRRCLLHQRTALQAAVSDVWQITPWLPAVAAGHDLSGWQRGIKPPRTAFE